MKLNREKIGIIAGNRLLPVLLAQELKRHADKEVAAVCFKGETSRAIMPYLDSSHWINPGAFGLLRHIVKKENCSAWIMAGQISPWRLFRRHGWDQQMHQLVEAIADARPHTIFNAIIDQLQADGARFIDSTLYLKNYLAQRNAAGLLSLPRSTVEDIDFGVDMISRFVELDVGQTIVVKHKSVAALEALEGTDSAIQRGWRVAGKNCVVIKFSKQNQDLRFDVPVVGMATLRLLKKIKAAALVLEQDSVIILEKEKFLACARRWGIPVIGKTKCES